MSNKVEQLFTYYESEAKFYARKLFDLEYISLKREDVMQEFRIKLWEVLLTYEKSWNRYKETSQNKPIPLPYYIKSALKNHVYDYIQDIQKNKQRITVFTKIEGLDVGSFNENQNEIIPDQDTYVINGINLLMDLKGVDRRVYILFLKGYEAEKIATMLRQTELGVKTIIRRQKRILQRFENVMYQTVEQNYTLLTFEEE